MSDNSNFDPSKAQVGPYAILSGRQGLVDPRALVNDGFRHKQASDSDAAKNIGRSSGEATINRELNNHEKEAHITNSMDEPEFEKEARGMPTPAKVETPGKFVSDDRFDESSRHGPIDTDMEVHGAGDIPKPDIKDLVRARLSSLRAEVKNKEKDVLKKDFDRQEARYEQNQSMDSSIEIDRMTIKSEEGQGFTSAGNLSKTAESLISLLRDEDINPIKLMLILDQAWGSEWYEWEIETINQTAEMEGVDIARINQDKIMALKVLKNTDSFFQSPRVFEKVCLSFAGKQVDWGHVQEPRTHEIASCVALVERYIIENPFSDKVAAYVAASALRDGYVLLPRTLSFAEIPFSMELASVLGDVAIEKQERLMEALDSEDESIFESEDAVQYMRLVKCQYHVQDQIDGAKA